ASRGCAGASASPASARAPIIDRPPAKPIACQSSRASTGDRDGQDALASATGTGPASAMVTTARSRATATIVACGTSSGTAAADARSTLVIDLSALAQQAAQHVGVLGRDAADEPAEHTAAVGGLPERLVHQLGDVVGPGGHRPVVVRTRGAVRADQPLLLQPAQHGQ